ncbi:hypothetical protein [Actinoplanes sp. NPDC026670]|uniref:hypothetical protein n=1 Tax=Actinoplanes sp. NPDC026670 TaxID=3154700 RepID=UPI0033EDB85D
MIEPSRSARPRWLPLAAATAAGVAGLAAAAVAARRRKPAVAAVTVVEEAPTPQPPPPVPLPPRPVPAPPGHLGGRTRFRVILLAFVVGVVAGWGVAEIRHEWVESECASARSSYQSSSYSVGAGSLSGRRSLPDECDEYR